MLTPDRLLRLTMEIIFLLLGTLVMWLGLTGHILFNRRGMPWIALGAVLIVWGVRALYKPSRTSLRWDTWTRGFSLTLLGIVMLAISRVPFLWVGPLLAIVGALLVLRGIVGFALALRTN